MQSDRQRAKDNLRTTKTGGSGLGTRAAVGDMLREEMLSRETGRQGAQLRSDAERFAGEMGQSDIGLRGGLTSDALKSRYAKTGMLGEAAAGQYGRASDKFGQQTGEIDARYLRSLGLGDREIEEALGKYGRGLDRTNLGMDENQSRFLRGMDVGSNQMAFGERARGIKNAQRGSKWEADQLNEMRQRQWPMEVTDWFSNQGGGNQVNAPSVTTSQTDTNAMSTALGIGSVAAGIYSSM
jgi:hypothetical protein